MKLLHFDDFKLGVLNGDTVIDVSDIANEVPHIGAHDRINGLIENFDNCRARLEAAASEPLLPPVRPLAVAASRPPRNGPPDFPPPQPYVLR